MSRFAIAGLVILAAYLPVSANAVGKTTADPNAARPNTAGQELVHSSAGTAQKVTYEAKRKTVVSILADLSKMTGVTLKAGYGADDWQVRDRRMSIFAKDIPLSNLMNSMARVMKFKWSKSDNDGVVSYKFYMDREALLDALRENLAKEDMLKKRQIEARREFLSSLQEADGMSEDELQQLKTQNPYVYVMTKIGWGGVFADLVAEVPKARQAWLSGEELVLEMRSLSPAVQQRLMKLQHGLDQGMIDIGTLTINNSENPMGASTFIGSGAIKFDGPMYETDFQDPQSDMAKASARLTIAYGMYDPNDKAEKSEQNRLKGDLDRVAKSTMTTLLEPLTQHPDDPALSAKVKLKVANEDFADTLCALAKSSGYAVVSDSFRRQFKGLGFSQDEIQIREVLDKLESECCYNWERHGSALELHDRLWFKKRSVQIPDAWLEVWRTALRDNGSLDLNELSQIAMLTKDQYWENIVSDEMLGSLSTYNVAYEDNGLLRLYAGLNKSQRAAILSKQGLSLDTMVGDHSQAIHALLPKGVSEAGLKLLGTREAQGKRIQYTFNLVSSDGTTAKQWKIACPVYEPKDKPKDNTAEPTK